jgi:anti-sigma factor RsiW
MDDDGLTCRELVELVTDYFEGALGAEDRARFEAHVAACPGCEAHLHQMRTTVALVGAASTTPERREITALLEAFRGWQRERS